MGHYEHAADPHKAEGVRGDLTSAFTYKGVDYEAFGDAPPGFDLETCEQPQEEYPEQ